MALSALRAEIEDEVSMILAPDFKISVTNTGGVPHSADPAITFPNLDAKSQGTKLLETTVLYIDMRRSTQLSFQHRRETVAKLYTAFVRAMTRAANEYGGEVRGIIGDRVMVIFDQPNCFGKAIDTAIVMNSVCKYVINRHFTHNEVAFGIGIDFGRMMATKTGVYRRGAAQQSYRSLVWLGRPANVASKLTDNANKPEEKQEYSVINVAYSNSSNPFLPLEWKLEWPHTFVAAFYYESTTGLMRHVNPLFKQFKYEKRTYVTKHATPPILFTEEVWNGLRRERPNYKPIAQGWFKPTSLKIAEYRKTIYGGDVIFSEIRN